MKKCFISMSINYQLFFGIFGIAILFGTLGMILVLLSSIKIFYSYNDYLTTFINEIDSNIVSLNGESNDLFAQLLIHQGKSEIFLLRNLFENLYYYFGNDIISNINIDETFINDSFITKNQTCKNNEQKCFFYFYSSRTEPEIKLKKTFIFMRNVIDISLDTYSMTQETYKIFSDFYFYENKSRIYFSYKFTNLDDFSNKILPEGIMKNVITAFNLDTSNLIEKINNVSITDLTYNELFLDNTFIFFPSSRGEPYDPFYDNGIQNIHFGSLNFNKTLINYEEKFQKNKISIKNLDYYISVDAKINLLANYALNTIQKNKGIFSYLVDWNMSYTPSKTLCLFIKYFNYTYSDESMNNNINLTINYLNITDFQIYGIRKCFESESLISVFTSDLGSDLKLSKDIFSYSYKQDINNVLKIKAYRIYSPSYFIKSFLQIKFLSNYSVYFFIIKISNNILILENIIKRMTHRYSFLILIFIFILWFFIYIVILIQLYLVTDKISSPLRKLIKNISLTQNLKKNNSNENINIEKIYYEEDKDINNLFQLCQKLIEGGLKKNEVDENKKQGELNVYNNISKVKTNNMIINEFDILNQRNQKYNEIFDKGKKSKKKDDTFSKEIYNKFDNVDLQQKMKKYYLEEMDIYKKSAKDKKEEFIKEMNNIENEDDEYKFLYFINKSADGFIPINRLYRCYDNEFNKKSKKRKNKL